MSKLEKLINDAKKSGKVNLNFSIQDQDWVAIDGDKHSLEFLGNLLLAVTKGKQSEVILDSPGPFFDAGYGVIVYKN